VCGDPQAAIRGACDRSDRCRTFVVGWGGGDSRLHHGFEVGVGTGAASTGWNWIELVLTPCGAVTLLVR